MAGTGRGVRRAGPGQGGPGRAGTGQGGPARAGTGQSGPAVSGRGPAAGAGADHWWLGEAIELSRRCPPSPSAFSVGAILVAADGSVIATGFSRERDPHDHAEEAALAKAAHAGPGRSSLGPQPGGSSAFPGAGSQPADTDPRLADATVYSSLEPCAARASRPRTCAELIITAGIRRVVIAWLEPPVFVEGGGAARLRGAGVTVIQIPEFAAAARAANAHLLAG